MTTQIIEAGPDEQDAILLDRVAAWAAAGPVSFLRANKPTWRIEVTRHEPPLAEDALDAVADTRLVLSLLPGDRPRREIVLRAMRRATDALGLGRDERLRLHHEGFAWAVALGRWDDAGRRALDAKLASQREGIEALLAAPCDPASEARWARLSAGPGDPIAAARRAIGHHANRLGVFAEAEAILHYFLFRLDSDGARA